MPTPVVLSEFTPQTAAQVFTANAKQVVLPVARSAGLPVDMPAVQQGIATLIPALAAAVFDMLARQGVTLVIYNTSPMYAQLAQHAGVQQQAQATYLAPGPAGGNGHAPVIDQRASQQMRHAFQNPMTAPLPPNAIIPGQPLPQMPAPATPGVKSNAPVAVPLQAPLMPGPVNDAPPGATDVPMPSFD